MGGLGRPHPMAELGPEPEGSASVTLRPCGRGRDLLEQCVAKGSSTRVALGKGLAPQPSVLICKERVMTGQQGCAEIGSVVHEAGMEVSLPAIIPEDSSTGYRMLGLQIKKYIFGTLFFWRVCCCKLH